VNGYVLAVDLHRPQQQGVWGADGRLLPPSDAAAAVASAFVCCAVCAATPVHLRCSGCPRGEFRLNLPNRNEAPK